MVINQVVTNQRTYQPNAQIPPYHHTTVRLAFNYLSLAKKRGDKKELQVASIFQDPKQNNRKQMD